MDKARISQDDAWYKQAVRELTDGKRVALVDISRVRHKTAVAKCPYVVDHIQSLLDQGEKVAVFIHHHDVGESIANAFPQHVLLDGDTSLGRRQKAVDMFQEGGGQPFYWEYYRGWTGVQSQCGGVRCVC